MSQRVGRRFPVDPLLEELAELEARGLPVAVATVVRTVGSTPRKAGARMIVYPDGRLSGTIGGGCGEAEVRQAALAALDTGQPQLYTVDLLGGFGDDREVCGGKMEVYIEPLLPGRPHGWEAGGGGQG